MSFDIAGYVGIMAEVLLKLPDDLLSKYSLFKKTMKIMQNKVEVPRKASSKKTAISLWCILWAERAFLLFGSIISGRWRKIIGF